MYTQVIELSKNLAIASPEHPLERFLTIYCPKLRRLAKTASIAVTIKIHRPTVLKTKMKQTTQFTAIIERERDGYVSLCPELDIASQGDTIEEARNNLIEALELFFETADPSEIQQRLHTEVFVTRLEVNIG
ncbi:type II toxin-antitoxin system HicB family antitoxin [Nostoc sp.]|uniref:type II toxin-antitoxin system HicB family antitoxin n=2 Tax=Nostoc sp. TaxID=1180 RepID=UPI002FF51697